MYYMLPQEELVKLFSQNFVRPIASTLQIQQHKTFKEAIVQVVIIKRVKIQDGEIKSKKRENYKSKISQGDQAGLLHMCLLGVFGLHVHLILSLNPYILR